MNLRSYKQFPPRREVWFAAFFLVVLSYGNAFAQQPKAAAKSANSVPTLSALVTTPVTTGERGDQTIVNSLSSLPVTKAATAKENGTEHPTKPV